MTNNQIIFNEVIANEIMTEAEAIAILESGYRLPVHTYAEWQRTGYQVQKGQKAKIKTMLWKPVTKKAKTENEEDETKMIMVKASLFTADQVAKIETLKTA